MPFDLKTPITRRDITKAAITGIRLTRPGFFLVYRKDIDADGNFVDGAEHTADCTLTDNPTEYAACLAAIATIESATKEIADPAVVVVTVVEEPK